jgi:hypothetical protein
MFHWVKTAGADGLHPYHLYVPIVLKSGNLSLLELSGPVQTCNGIALPLLLPCCGLHGHEATHFFGRPNIQLRCLAFICAFAVALKFCIMKCS